MLQSPKKTQEFVVNYAGWVLKYLGFKLQNMGLFTTWFEKHNVQSNSDIRHDHEQKNPANIYSFKVKNRNTEKRCEICSKLTIKTHFSSVSIVDFELVNIN